MAHTRYMPVRRISRLLATGAWIAIALILAWSASLFVASNWNEWRERTIQSALTRSGEPAFWWLPSWRAEFRERQFTEIVRQEIRDEYRAGYQAAKRLLQRGAITSEQVPPNPDE